MQCVYAKVKGMLPISKYILISTIVCLCLSSCSIRDVRDWYGKYTGNNTTLILYADSCCSLEIRYDLIGHRGVGNWIDDGSIIILNFPYDSCRYESKDISKLLTRSLHMETVVLEKHRRGKLFWRNRGYLIKKKDDSQK